MKDSLLLTNEDIWAKIIWTQAASGDMQAVIDAHLDVYGQLQVAAYLGDCHEAAEQAAKLPYSATVWPDSGDKQWRRVVLRRGKTWLFYSVEPRQITPRHKACVTIERIISASRYDPQTLLAKYD